MTSKNAKLWIWISLALGFNNRKVKGLHELYPDISVFASGGKREWRMSGLFDNNELNKLSNTDSRSVDKIISECSRLGYSVISIDDPAYPQCLREIYAPPAVLYIEGKLPDIDNRLTIGIVGTRSASKYGTDNSFKFGYSLSRCGVCVVSGGALGIDCASHYGVLSAGGVTVCVLGCGINYPYLVDNAKMRKDITRRGAVISEYPPGTPPKSYHFPARNRIIAALSDGVLIIESGEKSGSLITADFALEMGKELFALMGNNDPRNIGSNRRIKEGTAIPVTDFMDILYAFDNLYVTPEDDWGESFDSIDFAEMDSIPVKHSGLNRAEPANNIRKKTDNPPKSIHIPTKKTDISSENKKPEQRKIENLTGDVRAVYEVLSETPVHIDTLSEKMKLPVFKLLPSLTMLQMLGLAKEEPGRLFRLSE